jgi:hypothetical protein
MTALATDTASMAAWIVLKHPPLPLGLTQSLDAAPAPAGIIVVAKVSIRTTLVASHFAVIGLAIFGYAILSHPPSHFSDRPSVSSEIEFNAQYHASRPTALQAAGLALAGSVVVATQSSNYGPCRDKADHD